MTFNRSPHLSKEINDVLEWVDKQEEVVLDEFPIGTLIKVQTRNTLYTLKWLDTKNKQGNVVVQGGTYFPEKRKTWLDGCTFGGSMIMAGKLVVGMFMEIWSEGHGTIRTTRIRRISVKRQIRRRP